MGTGLRGKTAFPLLYLTFIFFTLTEAIGQDVHVIESNGSVAVVSGGRYAGLRVNDTVRIMRMRNNSWKEISRARITEVRNNLARIEIVEGAPLVNFKPGDFVMKVRLTAQNQPRVNDMPIERPAASRFPDYSPYRGRNVYLGPTAGVLLPVGKLQKYLKPSFGAGGMLGIKFRSNFDINTRFFYSYDSPDWYFWNILVLGRKYLDKNFTIDLGYGIGYPIIAERERYVEVGDNVIAQNPLVALGYIGGMSAIFEMTDSMWFEIGVLGHYYPNFTGIEGTFVTIQGRLIL
jgi:hypothetical protein